MRTRRTTLTATALVAALVYARSRYLRSGATRAEARMPLPGDSLLRHAHLRATRAITIDAPPEAVWPWLLQLGQGRGGFYSYDGLENLVGLDIHSADRVVPEWQHTDVGSAVEFAPGVGLLVVEMDPNRSLVLQGGAPLGAVASPYDFTWAFVLDGSPQQQTRLVVRERYTYQSWWAPLLVEPVEVVSSVMSPKMLHGIKERAERVPARTAAAA